MVKLFVKNSSWHDANPYRAAEYEAALKNAGARIHPRSSLNVWTNQPEVVVFSGISPDLASKVLESDTDLKWPIVLPVDWKLD